METQELVTLSYSQLLEQSGEVLAQLERAFGPQGLGVIAVSNIYFYPGCTKDLKHLPVYFALQLPGYSAARDRLLPLAEKLEQLPDASKKRLEDPESSYSFGWSFGKEALDDGKKDTLKGSFYANPLHDVPTTDAHLQRRYPSYCRPNLWPSSDLPSLEPAFKSLGEMTVNVGLLLVSHCERLVSRRVAEAGGTYREGSLRAAIESSRAHKARLLIYMPRDRSGSASGSASTALGAEEKEGSSTAAVLTEPRPPTDATERLWCAWHLDHGALTGLTRAQFRCDGAEVPAPDTTTGLFVRKQDGTEHQVRIPEGCLAFQMGQAMSIMSGGVLCATPHCVKAPQTELSRGISRATFAVFMQPMWDEPLLPPEGTHPSEGVRKTWAPWQEGMTFGAFSEETVANHYYPLQL